MRALFALVFIFASVWLTAPIIADAETLDQVANAQSAYEQSPDAQTRAGLLDALGSYEGAPTVETVQAYVALLIGDSTNPKTDKRRDSALAMAEHLEPVSSILPKLYAESRFVAAVSLFNDAQDSDAMREMAHVEGFTRQIRDEADEIPDWADDLKWKATAWSMAMGAYFESMNERYPSSVEIEEILASYGADTASLNEKAMQTVDESGLPHCPGQMIQRPKLRYPAGNARRGMFGAVILGLEFDADGAVINPRVLASIPEDEFDKKSLRVVGKWRFKPDTPEDVGVTCRLNRTEVVQPLVFQMR